MEGGWVDLPLVPEFRLGEPLRGVFPFVSKYLPMLLSREGMLLLVSV